LIDKIITYLIKENKNIKNTFIISILYSILMSFYTHSQLIFLALPLRKSRNQILFEFNPIEEELMEAWQLNLEPSFKYQKSKGKHNNVLDQDEKQVQQECILDILTKHNIPKDITIWVITDYLREPTFAEVYFYTQISCLQQSPEEHITDRILERMKQEQQSSHRCAIEHFHDLTNYFYTKVTSNIDALVTILAKEQILIVRDVLNEINNIRQEHMLLSRHFDNFTRLKQRSRYPVMLTSFDAIYIYELILRLFQHLGLTFQTSCAILRHPTFQHVCKLVLQNVQEQMESKTFIFDDDYPIVLTVDMKQHIQDLEMIASRCRELTN